MQKRRRFFGQEDGEPLAEFLNVGGAGAELLEKLLEAGCRLRDSTQPMTRQAEDRMLSVLKEPGPLRSEIRRTPSGDGPRPGRERDRAKALFDINCILRRVSLAPKLTGTVRMRWRMFWNGQGVSGSAARALFHLQQLALRDQLYQVRRCRNPKCQKWFFAGRPQRKSCSAACRTKVYESSVERKAARREYALREYTRIYKEAP